MRMSRKHVAAKTESVQTAAHMQPTLHATRWWIHVDTTNRPTSRLPTMDNMVLPIWIACRQQNVHKTHEILQFKSE
jgi:hypothetical protein